MNAVHGRLAGRLVDEVPEVRSDGSAGRADPAVVSHVGRGIQRGLAVTADGEPLGMVLPRPLVSSPVQDPHPPVVFQPGPMCGIRHGRVERTPDQDAPESAVRQASEQGPPLGGGLFRAPSDPQPATEAGTRCNTPAAEPMGKRHGAEKTQTKRPGRRGRYELAPPHGALRADTRCTRGGTSLRHPASALRSRRRTAPRWPAAIPSAAR